MGTFERGIGPALVDALGKIAALGGWWRDVLADPDLVIGVRKDYLDVYWRGQALFKEIRLRHGKVTARTHVRYLLDPDLADRVRFDGASFDLSALQPKALVQQYGAHTLDRLKRAARPYTDAEKTGVHEIVTGSPRVVDVEVTIPAGAVAGVGSLPRLDIAAVEQAAEGSAALVFWEAKTYLNHELRANGPAAPPVLGQICKYRQVLGAHRDQVLDSYRRVAANLVAIADMSDGARTVDAAVRAVAQDPKALRMPEPVVGLLIFGFDQPQKQDPVWQHHLAKLQAKLGAERVRARGKASAIRI